MTADATHPAAHAPVSRAAHRTTTRGPGGSGVSSARLLRVGVIAATLAGLAGVGAYAVPRLASRAEPAVVSARDLAPATPTTYGVVRGGDRPRQVRWSTTAEDLLNDPGAMTPRIQVITAGPPAGSDDRPDGPVLALASGVGGLGAQATATARVAGIDSATGEIRWRGPVLGDVPECAATARLLACGERTADAGRVVLLDPGDGREIGRVPVPGRVARIAVAGETTYVVSATPDADGTRIDLTRVEPTGDVTWTRSEHGAPGSMPGAVLVTGGAVAVTGVSVAGREFVAAAADGTLAADRRPGAAIVPLEGSAQPVAANEGEWSAVAGGPALAGIPAVVGAHDDATRLPLLASRWASAGGTGSAAGELVAYADARHAQPAWTMPAARPLAACGGRLVVASAGTAGPELAAIEPATGAEMWRAPIDGQVPTSAVCTSGTVIVSGRGGSGSVTALRLDTGAVSWASAPTGLAPADAEPARLTARGEDLLVASRLTGSARLDCLG
ncbi:MAG: PQQ-binding-like beta-propeller repeat protein [Austwickia sp.]|jgi:outer membrane protein assembly factor BamB|nr:MAG: PQQ-binding-like beta-propeller repeat protein [Austwickia sp.]